MHLSGKLADLDAEPAVLFSRFDVLATLGTTSFWRGYEVLDRERKRRGMLHVVASHAPDFEQRLHDARLWESLNLPGIAMVEEVATFEGGFYVLTQKVEGTPLSTWMVAPPPSLEAILTLFRELARTLAACHQVGVFWGSVDPQHVLVDAQGRPRIATAPATFMSEGALPREERSPSVEVLQRAYSHRGRPGSRYCAPELEALTGVDARSDQYTWAIMLWEALAGLPPFSATPAMPCFDAKIETKLPRPTQIPSALIHVLHRALSPVARDRWRSMDAVLKALDQRKRSKRGAWLTAGVLATSLAAGAAFSSAIGHAHDQENVERPAVAAMQPTPAEAATPEPAAPPSPADKLRSAIATRRGGSEPEAKAAAMEEVARLFAAGETFEDSAAVLKATVEDATASEQAALWREVGDALASSGSVEHALRAYEQASTALMDAEQTSPSELLPLATKVFELEAAPEVERLRLGTTIAKRSAMETADLAPRLVALAEALASSERAREALQTYRETFALVYDAEDITGETYVGWALRASQLAVELEDREAAKTILVRALKREDYDSGEEARLRFALAQVLWAEKKQVQGVEQAEEALALLGKSGDKELRQEIERWLDG